MVRSVYQQLARKSREAAEKEGSFQAVYGRVVNNRDPEYRGRVQVEIGDYDERLEDWIEPLNSSTEKGGYGFISIPPVGTEVRLFSELGQGIQFFYSCVRNEDSPIPGDTNDEVTKVFRFPGDVKFIVGGNFFIYAGCNIVIKTEFGDITIDPGCELHLHPKRKEVRVNE